MAPRGKRSGPFVVACGDEDYLLDRLIEKVKIPSGRHILSLNGNSVNERDLIDLCESSTYDDSSRVIILDDAHKVKVGKSFDAYVESKSIDDDKTVLVAILRTEKISEVWKKAGSKGATHSFARLKRWETDKLVKRASTEASRFGLRIDDEVLSSLIRYTGNDLRVVANELGKLAQLTKTPTREDVASIVSVSRTVEPYEVAEVATAKDSKKAMNLVSAVFHDLGDGASVPITAALIRQIEKLTIVRQMLDHRDDIEVIAARLEIHKYPLQKDIIPRAQKFSLRGLVQHMNRLCKLETQVKGAARSKRTLVELAVLSIAS